MPTNHTPTPWRILTGTDNVLIGIPERSVAYVANDRAQVFEPAMANAALIVRAVNTHDALVAALRGVLAHEGERVVDGIAAEHDSDALSQAKTAAYDALKLARG